jgi:hypothetical protein
MKRRLYLVPLIFAAISLMACQKELSIDTGTNNTGGGGGTPPPPTYHIQCKVDGVLKTFNTNMLATNTTAGGIHAIGIAGTTAATAGADVINIVITGKPGATIVPGNYIETNTASFFTTAQYNSGSNLFAAGINMSPTPAFQVNITTLNSTEIQGSFSGACYGNLGLGPAKVTITEGMFLVKF